MPTFREEFWFCKNQLNLQRKSVGVAYNGVVLSVGVATRAHFFPEMPSRGRLCRSMVPSG